MTIYAILSYLKEHTTTGETNCTILRPMKSLVSQIIGTRDYLQMATTYRIKVYSKFILAYTCSLV